MIRTVEEFVEDMVSDGRPLKVVKAVAQSTRWREYKEGEILQIFENLTKNRKSFSKK